MVSADPYRKVVRKGTWLYAGEVRRPVYLLEQNYDAFWSEDEPEEDRYLNADGVAYYVMFEEPDPEGAESSLTSAGLSLESALRSIEEKTHGTVRWDDQTI
jgi:hypothetical protein